MNDVIMMVGFFAIILCFMWLLISLKDSYEEEICELRESHYEDKELWYKERQQLLDRIQAPSFDHLKAAEVRVIKAQKEEKPIERVELL